MYGNCMRWPGTAVGQAQHHSPTWSPSLKGLAAQYSADRRENVGSDAAGVEMPTPFPTIFNLAILLLCCI